MIRLGPATPLPASSRPLDVCPYSKPYARIVRYNSTRSGSQVRGYVDMAATLIGMAPGQVVLVRSRLAHDLPRVKDAAAKGRHPDKNRLLPRDGHHPGYELRTPAEGSEVEGSEVEGSEVEGSEAEGSEGCSKITLLQGLEPEAASKRNRHIFLATS